MAADEDSPFWDIAEHHLASGAERSTMMGYPCLRVDGEFFASLEPSTGNMIVKLPADRVDTLVESEIGLDFAPNGRRFREWCAIPQLSFGEWESLLGEARRFAENK
jgi:hypothetical protein